ncbi:MAG: SDR family NAD(P)-dependent oxidoreductase, partial [Rhodospirillaceae bacterium]|nr:SDR family NAD(P)-dependent oxidoreductase [Rhodospirillaceae bacterium]
MTESGGRVAGKVAIVTGAASGLGKCTAEMLAAEGARVVLTDIDLAGAQAVATGIGDGAVALEQDVTDDARWQAVIAETGET